MNFNQPSQKLSNWLQQLRNETPPEDCPSKILSAIQRLSEMLKHMEIDVESILRQAKRVGSSKNKSKSNNFPLPNLFESEWDKVKEPIIHTIGVCGADRFITFKPEVIGVLEDILREIQEIFGESQERVQHLSDESRSCHNELVSTKKELEDLKDKYIELQKSWRIQESYMCRDYQLILQRIGSNPSVQKEQEIKQVTEEALEEIGVNILWESPEGDNGEYFITQNDSKAKASGVARPCLIKESEVIHKGVILNKIQD